MSLNRAKKPAILWKGGRGKTVESGNIQVQHEGEYVLTTDGKKDFGEISPDVAQAIRRQAGKIRLRAGEQNGKPGDYGEKHIERRERLQELYSSGYKNARDFVQDVARNYTALGTTPKRLNIWFSRGADPATPYGAPCAFSVPDV
jgi:hypothetical protein